MLMLTVIVYDSNEWILIVVFYSSGLALNPGPTLHVRAFDDCCDFALVRK